MKNRTSIIIVGILVLLALLGLKDAITTDLTGLLQGIAVIVLVGLTIYFVVRKVSASNPQKKEQRAFLKAAKKSKKRFQQKNGETSGKTSSLGKLTSLKKNNKTKKKSPAHLTVIDGKKSKKKNRASF